MGQQPFILGLFLLFLPLWGKVFFCCPALLAHHQEKGLPSKALMFA